MKNSITTITGTIHYVNNNIKPTSTKTEAIKSFKPRATTTTKQPKEGTKNNLLGRRWTTENKPELGRRTRTTKKKKDQKEEAVCQRRNKKREKRSRGSMRVTHMDAQQKCWVPKAIPLNITPWLSTKRWFTSSKGGPVNKAQTFFTKRHIQSLLIRSLTLLIQGPQLMIHQFH